MKRLILMRHAKSSWDDSAQDDHDRPLNARGQRAATLVGAHLEQLGVRPDLALCSSARRTQETWRRVEAVLTASPRVRVERALYLASGDSMLDRLRELEDDVTSVVLVAHHPGTCELARALAGSGPAAARARLRGKFPTGALADLEVDLARWRDLAPGKARLVSFTTPKDLV